MNEHQNQSFFEFLELMRLKHPGYSFLEFRPITLDSLDNARCKLCDQARPRSEVFAARFTYTTYNPNLDPDETPPILVVACWNRERCDNWAQIREFKAAVKTETWVQKDE